MGSSIKKLLEGYVRIIELSGSGTLSATSRAGPPANKQWLIIGGLVFHVNATASSLEIADVGLANNHESLCTIPLATATGSYPIFNTQANVETTLWTMNMVTGEEVIVIYGDAAVRALIKVIEFDVQ